VEVLLLAGFRESDDLEARNLETVMAVRQSGESSPVETGEFAARRPSRGQDLARREVFVAPWFGVRAGLRIAAAAWWNDRSRRLRRRRMLLLGTMTASFSLSFWWLQSAVPSGLDTILVTIQSALTAWLALGFHIAMAGSLATLYGDDVARPHPTRRAGRKSPMGRTAIVVPIRNEDVRSTFAGITATWESVCHLGMDQYCDLHVLSDTDTVRTQREEFAAYRRMRQLAPSSHQIYYRLRRNPTGRKVGNIGEFCDRAGRLYEYLLVLDADSVLEGACIRELVSIMEGDSRIGIVQTVPQIYGAETLHSWAQQFSSATTGRLFIAGWQWLYGDAAPYWGHNALIRMKPFIEHCGLAPLSGTGPLSGQVLSHDIVEAALMRRAGFACWIVPDIQGSFEQQPSHLLEEERRDQRWCRGNLQHLRLIAEPSLHVMHRLQFLVGAIGYGVSLMWAVSLLLGLAAAASGRDFTWSALIPWIVNAVLLIVPRILAVVIVSRSAEHRSYGAKRFTASTLVSFAIHAVSAPMLLLGHSVSIIRLLRGSPGQWQPAQRNGAPSLNQAFRALLGRITFALGLVVAVLVLHSPNPLLLLSVALPLILMGPIVTLTGDPGIARWVARRIPLYVSPTVQSSPTLARRQQLLSHPRGDVSRGPRHALEGVESLAGAGEGERADDRGEVVPADRRQPVELDVLLADQSVEVGGGRLPGDDGTLARCRVRPRRCGGSARGDGVRSSASWS
jgi:membrane glycosyltransferase